MSHLNLRFPPELLSLDNAMEAYMEEFRRKNMHVVPPHKEQDKPRITFADDVPPADKWSWAHLKFWFGGKKP